MDHKSYKFELSVIIPVYRGRIIIAELTERIADTLKGKYNYEILFICDKCDDISFRIVEELKNADPCRIKYYRFRENYGQHKAILYGIGKASGDLLVTMDEDLQHDPSDIIRLIEKQIEGDYDIVYGRFNDPRHNRIRNIISAILRKILKHFIPTLYENYSPYRLIKRHIASKTSTMVCPYTFIDDFLSRITQKIAFVNVLHHKRFKGRSSYTFSKLIKHGIYILLAYSRVISWFLSIASLIIILGSFLSVISVVSPGAINADLLNSRTITGIFATGLLFIIISVLGTFINYRNIKLNTRPVRLSNEDTI